MTIKKKKETSGQGVDTAPKSEIVVDLPSDNQYQESSSAPDTPRSSYMESARAVGKTVGRVCGKTVVTAALTTYAAEKGWLGETGKYWVDKVIETTGNLVDGLFHR